MSNDVTANKFQEFKIQEIEEYRRKKNVTE